MDVIRRLRPSPAMVVAVAALIVALAGSAVAVDKITSNDIAKNAVLSQHIEAGQVKNDDTDLVKHARAPGEVQHSASASAELGPNLTLRAKRGDVLRINARVTIRNVLGSQECYVNLAVDGPGDEVDSELRVMDRQGGGPFVTYANNSSGGSGFGLNSDPLDLPIVRAGRHRVFLTYQVEAGNTCGFADRNLWVEQIR